MAGTCPEVTCYSLGDQHCFFFLTSTAALRMEDAD